MDTAERVVQLARQLYGQPHNNLAYQQQAVIAQLVAAEIHAMAIKSLEERLDFRLNDIEMNLRRV